MLKQRFITASVLIALTLALLFWIPSFLFCIVTGIVGLWALWEWSALSGMRKLSHRILYLALSYFLMIGLLKYFSFNLLLISFFWWCIALILVLIYPRLRLLWAKGVLIRAVMGWLTVVFSWVIINFMHEIPQGPWMLLYIFVLIWGADSAAYFVGKQWGRHALLPKVSPGKTWEGTWGALGAGVIITFIQLLLLHLPYPNWPWALGLALITIIFSIVGDLFESMLKRQAGLKDSGSLLPGHGGLLDRLDSLTAAIPVFALGAFILGRVAG